MHLETFPVGPLQANCYILHNDTQAVCVDPGDEAKVMLAYLKEHNLKLTHILCTHLHVDHVGACADLAEATGAVILASENDTFLTRSEMGMGGAFGFPKIKPYTFQGVEPGPLEVLGVTCTVMATPGHTPGGLCYYFPDQGLLFTGDTLFYHSVGRTDFPRGNSERLVDSITNPESGLFSLPDHTRVLPGHGIMTTIGGEKAGNPFLNGEMLADY